jgi:hypothetical protein
MKLRLALAAFSVILALGIFVYTAHSWEKVRVVKDREVNNLVLAGIELKVEQSRSEFQLALLVMGALWTVMLAKKDEARLVLSAAPELVMFLCANVLLLSSAVYHFLYVEDISYVYSLAGGMKGASTIPDVLGSGINNPYQFQFWSLVGGVVVTGLTLLSAHKLK